MQGRCDCAIVAGSYLCLHPQSAINLARVVPMSRDGKTFSFDERAQGCARSEAINVLFLQRAKNALRIYADILHVKSEYVGMIKESTSPKFGFYRGLNNTIDFLKTFYKEAGISADAIEYFEAFGCATPEVDKVELQAIQELFCKNRDNKPLLIGSVMSNIGYGEAASGLSAITKVLLGYHNGKLAANLHCGQPRKDIEALHDGRMRILDEHQTFDRSYVAVNGLSVTGVNSHVLLHGHYKPKDLSRYKTSIPHLVTVTGRHEEAVKWLHQNLKSNPVDDEQLALLRNIHKRNIAGHVGRGYIILQADEEQKTVILREKTDYADLSRRPLWFVYSGMGSQWAGMGTQLMRIPIFVAAIERCRQALKPTGLDIVEIITSPDETIFNNILHSFVGIAAVQIGLTDILHAMGLKPDGIIGHSVGELGCAYADGCLTAEEMILSAYYRGMVSLETKFIHGSMAAVGVGYKQISQMCPPEIEVACRNGPDSSTISGPSDVMREFVAKLTADGIFAKEVPCSNIAYHSRYIADAGPGLLKYLQKAIPNPKVRSKRWLSTSVPEARWNEPIAELCSAEYLTNNLLSPVLFEETSLLVPSEAVLVEIAPAWHPDNTLFLLEAIGKLHMEGFNFDVQALYPKVEMPVSTGTPFLSHLVKWAHDERWPVPIHCLANKRQGANCDFILALHDQEYSYVRGHTIRGDTLFPLAASLMLVWDTLSMVMGVPKRQMSVEFENIKSYAQPVLHDGRQLKLSVTIHRGEGGFEILDGISRVATGYIRPVKIQMIDTVVNNQIQTVHLTGEDIYQLLRDRDYSYGGEFQSIDCADESLSEAMIEWRDNWVTFIDGMLQLNMLRQQHNAVSHPTRIQKLHIDVKEHTQTLVTLPKLDGKVLVRAEVIEKSDLTRCGGVVLQAIKYQHLPPANDTKMTLKTLTFVPHFKSKLDISSTLEVYLQLVAENLNKDGIKVVGIQSKVQAEEGSMFKEINKVVNNLFGIKVNYEQISGENAINKNTFEDVDLILVQNLSRKQNVLQTLQGVLLIDQFVVTEENISNPNYEQYSKIYRVLSSHLLSEDLSKNQSVLQLVRWGPMKALTGTTTVCIRKKSDIDFLTSIRANLTSDQHLLVISSFPSIPSLKELIAYWRRDTTRNKVHLITVNNSNIDDVEKNLNNIEFAFNYVDHGKWGGEFYLSMADTMKESKNVTLQSAKFGDYNSLQWVQAPDLAESGVTVNVHYAGITSNDIKHANGSLFSAQNVKTYGMDFSGITERGQPVMGVVRSGAASSQVRAQPELLWPVPAHWSLEDAATVPLAYLQAFYCLGIKVQLLRGRTVLVHGGAGALGQAIISIALAHDCEVFTTVSDVHKKQFLLKLFPQLKADHIGKSRDIAFIDTLRQTVGEKKCDIIISSAKGSVKDITLKCSAFGGIFLDTSQIQNREDYDFGMSNLWESRTYSRVDFSSMLEPENVDNISVINKMISEGIARGYVRPLSRITYATGEVPRAFRFLAENSHRGRVLLRMKDNTIQAQYRLKCSPDHCYLILCNSTSFGVQLADRLVAKGVKLLYVHVQKQSSYLQYKIRSWQELGVKVGISSERLNSQKAVASLLTNATRLGPLEGVYVTTDDNNNDIYSSLISDLDVETKKISCDLKHFVVVYFGDNSIEKDVCLNRLYNQLPATVVTLPELKSESYNSYPKWRSAMDALESALQHTRGIILAHLERGPKPSLLKQIESLTGKWS
ncbi:unnamed protein product [Arctia plantaginis]|uniref:Ketosynthase family 3 (KS3) domain-containing protein n=1 Tax=Arctia plantaginis TaxID=874455 RepID=A0A8S0YLI7_ARCPL|nr:unnamed protein product [Arctia plantaginis]